MKEGVIRTYLCTRLEGIELAGHLRYTVLPIIRGDGGEGAQGYLRNTNNPKRVHS